MGIGHLVEKFPLKSRFTHGRIKIVFDGIVQAFSMILCHIIKEWDSIPVRFLPILSATPP